MNARREEEERGGETIGKDRGLGWEGIGERAGGKENRCGEWGGYLFPSD